MISRKPHTLSLIHVRSSAARSLAALLGLSRILHFLGGSSHPPGGSVSSLSRILPKRSSYFPFRSLVRPFRNLLLPLLEPAAIPSAALKILLSLFLSRALVWRYHRRGMNNDVKVIKSPRPRLGPVRLSESGQAPRDRAGLGLKNCASADYSQREIEMSRRIGSLFLTGGRSYFANAGESERGEEGRRRNRRTGQTARKLFARTPR